MAGTLIRAVAQNGGKAIAQRAIHRLSDGTLVAVIFDGNRNDISGDGGDNTNVGKIYVYSAPDGGTTWTLRATVTTDTVGTTDFFHYSSAIDASDNLHIAYVSHALNAVYVLLTKSAGPAYSVGTPATLFTNSTNEKAYAVDVDTMGATGTVAVVAVVTTNTSTNINTTHAYVGSVVTFNQNGTSVQVSPGTNHVVAPIVTVAACKDAIVSNVGTYVILSTFRTSGGFATLSTPVNIVQCNVSTGVVASNTLISNASSTASFNTTPFPMWITCIDTSRTFYVQSVQPRQGGVENGYNAQFMWTFTVNSAGTAVTDTIPRANYPIGPTLAPVWTPNGVVGFTTLSSGGSASLTNIVAKLSGTSVVLQPGAGNYWDNNYIAPSWVPYTGINRNFSSTRVDVMAVSDTSTAGIGCGVYYDRLHVPLAPASIVPVTGATVTTDRPAISANYKNDFDNVQLDEKVVWQLATDAGFTLNVKTVTDPDSVFSAPLNTGATNATVTETSAVTATAEIYQTTWFIRAAAIDTLGNQGAWSSAHTFVVSHPPTATGMSPNGGVVLAFGSGTITFAWTFSDPSPYDFQIGYEILVTKVSDGTTVADSGFISSPSGFGALAISSSFKNIPLQWQVRTYDTDSVTNGYTSPQTFSLADIPVPVFTAPLNGGTVTSGVPTITWTPGLSGGATEASWRFTANLAGGIVYDSGTVVGSATTFTMPPGYLHTAFNYTFTLVVTDSNGLSGTASVGVTTAWTPPANADLRVYLYEFNRKGFIQLGWTGANTDTAHFSVWNIYRKKSSDAAWTLLGSDSTLRDSYGFRDFGAASQTTYQYAVTQVTIAASGDVVESVLTTYVTVTTPTAPSYWILDPLGVVEAVGIYGVTGDAFTDEYETAEFVVVGRGRHIDIGSYLGANGSLNVSLRDKALGVPSKTNLFLNPGFQGHLVGVTPDNWTFSGGGTFGTLSTDYYNFYEPAPNGALTNLVCRVSSLATGGTNFIQLGQNVPLVRLPFTAAGQTFSASFWEALEPDLADAQSNTYSIGVQYYNISGTLLSTDEASATVVDHYETSGNGDASSGNWFRLARTLTVPAGAIDHITVYLKVFTTSGTVYPELFQGGAQLESGAVSQYFDGDMPGGVWSNGQYVSTSVGGPYTARQQRLDIATMVALDRPVYLRNPLGDILYVSLQSSSSPSGSQMTRLAGIGGGADYGTLVIPYLTVGF